MNDHKNLTAILVDDEPGSIYILEALLNKTEGVTVVDTTSDPNKVLSLFLKYKPDLIFIDIEMGNMSGLDVIAELHKMELEPLVIFTTAFANYAIPAINENAFGYLLKPIDEEELHKVIEKVQKHLQKHAIENKLDNLEKIVKNHHKLRFNTRSGFLLIHPNDIMYIEASANYSEVYQTIGRPDIISMHLGAIEEMLPEEFIRISRSHIINATWLTKVSGNSKKCYLKKGNDEIAFPVPEKQLPEIKKKLDR